MRKSFALYVLLLVLLFLVFLRTPSWKPSSSSGSGSGSGSGSVSVSVSGTKRSGGPQDPAVDSASLPPSSPSVVSAVYQFLHYLHQLSLSSPYSLSSTTPSSPSSSSISHHRHHQQQQQSHQQLPPTTTFPRSTLSLEKVKDDDRVVGKGREGGHEEEGARGSSDSNGDNSRRRDEGRQPTAGVTVIVHDSEPHDLQSYAASIASRSTYIPTPSKFSRNEHDSSSPASIISTSSLSSSPAQKDDASESTLGGRRIREEDQHDSLLGEPEPPCGEICQYDGFTARPGKGKGNGNGNGNNLYPRLTKRVHCATLIRRMIFDVTQKPVATPRRPPPALLPSYTMNGDVQLLVNRHHVSSKPPVYTSRPTLWKQPVCGPKVTRRPQYHHDGVRLYEVFDRYAHAIAGKVGVVVGSRSPWIECYLLKLNASVVITVEYGQIVTDHPRLATYQPIEFAQRVLNGTLPYPRIDFAVSFSSVEHSGLGRYGDALNPYGDLEAVAQIGCYVSPGALLFLGVPVDYHRDGLLWPLHRIYGHHRLPHLTANWDCGEVYPPDAIMPSSSSSNSSHVGASPRLSEHDAYFVNQPTIVCKKPL